MSELLQVETEGVCIFFTHPSTIWVLAIGNASIAGLGTTTRRRSWIERDLGL